VSVWRWCGAQALLEFLKAPGKDRAGNERPPIPVSGVSIGPIFKKDVIRASIMLQKKMPEYACILGFDVPISGDVRQVLEC
jgi:translation initiation factor 5B